MEETLPDHISSCDHRDHQIPGDSVHLDLVRRRTLRLTSSCHPTLVVLISVITCTFLFSPLPVRCENDLSLCDATSGSQCLNNATCVDRGHDFTCNCSSQEFTGWFCNVTTRQNCSGSPCLHSGSCTDLSITIGAETNVSSFNCTCRTGYEGPLCEREIDYCNKDGVVCANNGNCLNHPESQSFECLCNGTGYSGHNCTESINTCTLTCDNGQCLTDGQNQTCKCTAGYDGPTCSVPLDLCQNMSMCQHGQCNDTGCNCTGSGWNGAHCDVQKNECEDPDPICLHGGNCTDIEGGFKCNCSLGYEGDRCDRPNCSAVACLNNGHCIANSTDWSCKCPEFVEGSLCDSVGPCFNKPCDQSNTISCTQNITLQNYTCVCGPGWKGVNCTQDIDECLESDPLLKNQCANGTCVNTNGSYLCNCTPGYTGQLCGDEIDECETAPCAHGTCSDLINKFVCNCTGTGYTGETCSEDIDECVSDTRVCNDGTCKNLPGNYSCDCGDQYLGTNCSVPNPCYNKTCQNGGTCQTSNNFTSSSCMCSVGYEGVTCEKSQSQSKDTDLGVIIGPIIGGIVFIIIVIVVIAFIMTARSKRATRGAYSPSQQETMGSRVELGNVLKKPPEERLI